MGFSRWLRGMWFFAAAYFVGSCNVYGLNPFAVGLITAVSLTDENIIWVYIGLILGIFLHMPLVTLIRYGILMLGVALILGLKSTMPLKQNLMAAAFFSAAFSAAVSLTAYLFTDIEITPEQIIFESGIIFSASMLYSYGIKTIKQDYAKITVENQAAISVLALFATILYGMPVKAYGGIVVAEAVALFSILFAMYKFGFGIGMSWTVIAGTIVAKTTGERECLTVWLVVTIGAFAIQCLLRGGRITFALIYGMVYYLCGIFFYDTLLDESSIKAVLSALFVFLLAPNRFMLRVDDRVRRDELRENSPEWGRLIVSRVNALASAFKRIEYTLAGNVNTGIGFHEVGEIIEQFTGQLDQALPMRKTIEANVIAALAERDIQVKNIVLTKAREERYEVYVTARVRRGRIVAAEVIRKILEKEMGVSLSLKDESRSIVGHSYDVICLVETPEFKCKTAVRRMSRYDEEISGDNFYIGDIGDGQKLIMIADGMGNGENASKDSSAIIETLEELLAAGFDQDMSIRIVNSSLAEKSRGERFTTLDMLLLDLYTGYGRIYKQGAATTFIKRSDWLEMVKSTSLPVGIIEGAACEKCSKKFFTNDVIVMVSDGVLESIIFENKDEYMQELLENLDSDEPEDVVKYMAEQIKAMSGNRLSDDATIIACKLVKTL